MTGPNLTVETLHILDKKVFSKRKVYSIISSFHDQFRLISAYLVIFKIMMRETIADIDWDTPLTKNMLVRAR